MNRYGGHVRRPGSLLGPVDSGLAASLSPFEASPRPPAVIVFLLQIAFTGLVYPCLISAYVGQAAYLCEFPGHAGDAFYKSTPESAYWPMFAAAVMASIIASQAMISATFAIVKQSVALGCFPRVRVVHTSRRHEGQVYIPEVNFLLMAACVTVTAAFKETTKIGNAYGEPPPPPPPPLLPPPG